MDNTPGNDDAAAAPQDVEEGSAARRGRGKPLTNSERDAILHSLLAKSHEANALECFEIVSF